MDYKFNIGDKVIVIRVGYGVGPNNMDDVVEIVERGEYWGTHLGYKVSPPIGNTLSGWYNGFIGEESFEFVLTKGDIRPMKIIKKHKLIMGQ